MVIDLCTPVGDAMVAIDGLDTPVGPGSTLAYAAIVNEIKVQTRRLLVAQGAMPPVMTARAVVGQDVDRSLRSRLCRPQSPSASGAASEADQGYTVRAAGIHGTDFVS